MLTDSVGCEHSAVLHHGSLIRIGCLQFVFSVVLEEEHASPTTESFSKNEEAASLEVKTEGRISTDEDMMKDPSSGSKETNNDTKKE